MILLDTNVLILMLVRGSAEALQVLRWIDTRQALCTSSVCWYEFICGPVDSRGVALVAATLEDRIIPFTADHAREAFRLFDATGRQRRTRIHSMIAATAIVSNARLATGNTTDFLPFTSLGLRLAEGASVGSTV